MKTNIIVAVDANNYGIGYNGKIPWHFKEELEYFKKITQSYNPNLYSVPNETEIHKNTIIMGRKTWESLPKKLPNRVNIVVSSTLKYSKDSNNDPDFIVNNIEDAISKSIGHIFIIGGSELYRHALIKGYVQNIFITFIQGLENIKYDTYFPHINDENFTCISINNVNISDKITLKYCQFSAKTHYHEEMQYLSLIQKIIFTEGNNIRSDRTGTGTLSIFAPKQMRFSLLDDKFPLLTTKKVFFKGIVEELFWFLSGSTDVNKLIQKGVHIWTKNSDRSFLDSLGFTDRKEYDAGPIYGHQWRHFGAEYTNASTDYTGKGVDQIKYIIDTLKKDPTSRRLILMSWNPAVLHEIVLPPCHVMAQFYAKKINDKYHLSLQFYQRSADMGLGVPFNIASYALLLKMIAYCVDMIPNELIYVIGDAHVYKDHIEPLLEQIKRVPYEFPLLKIKETASKDIDKIVYSDLILENYKYHDTIKMNMSV